MKTMMLNLWAWIASDPLYALGAALVALVMLWKALPVKLRVSIEQRFPRAVGIVRTIVALVPDLIGAARVMRYQAIGGQSRVLVSDRAAAESDKLRELLKPEEQKPSESGFVERGVLWILGGIALLMFGAALLMGCPLPAPDGCTPFATRCGPSGIPQTCSGTQRWSHAPAARPCAELGSVCCRALSPYGNEVYACVPSSVCLPERADAGVLEEGGAQ